MTRQHPGCFDRPVFRGPDVTTGHDFSVRTRHGAGTAAAGHRCR